MLKAELHTHSSYSRGTKIEVEGLHSPAELVEQAARLGLDVLALTDHNCFQGVREAVKTGKKLGVLVLPGEEIKTEKGHLIGLGLGEGIAEGKSLEETIDLIHGQGGLALAPHPFDVKGEGLGLAASQCDAVEVFNSLNIDRFSNGKARRFAARKKLGTTVGSDAHFKEMVGLSLNGLKAEKDVDSILKAIRQNKTIVLNTNYIPAGWLTDWAIKRLKISQKYVRSYIENNYSQPKKIVCTNLLKLVNFSPGKIDYFFQGLGYFSFSLALVYASIKQNLRTDF